MYIRGYSQGLFLGVGLEERPWEIGWKPDWKQSFLTFCNFCFSPVQNRKMFKTYSELKYVELY